MSKKQKMNKNKTEEVQVFQQFKKQRIFQNISFVFVALVLAFGINSFVLNGEVGNKLQTNILSATKTIETKANIYLEVESGGNSDIIKIKAGQTMDKVQSLSLSLIYNPQHVELTDMFSNINGLELSNINNEEGITTLILTFAENQSIQKGKDIINFYTSKKDAKTGYINVINAHFKDSTEEDYQLTSSGIAF